MSVLFLLLGLALASDATAEIDGTKVVGRVTVRVAPEVVLDALADPTWENRVQKGNARVTPTKQEGACHQAAYVFPHPIMTTSYELRRCRTASGWDVSLVRSDSFDAYRARWTAVPRGDGTALSFEVDLTSSVAWVPDSLVRSETRKGVHKLMQAIGDWAATRASGPR